MGEPSAEVNPIGLAVEEAIEASRLVQSDGLHLTLDYLGESVRTSEEADAATRAYVRLLEVIVIAGIERNISLKLTQLGLDLDEAQCLTHLRTIVSAAAPRECFVRIDMENSPYVDPTLTIFETLWREGLRNVGVVIQAALRRSEQDVEAIIAEGGRIRLCKGAYKEPESVAFQDKAEVDEAYERLMLRLLRSGTYPALATHDVRIIKRAIEVATAEGIGRDTFEFQMLYGVRRDLQEELCAAGWRVRVYVPFGGQWYPYFMRRLAERPANVSFLLRNLWRERGKA